LKREYSFEILIENDGINILIQGIEKTLTKFLVIILAGTPNITGGFVSAFHITRNAKLFK
jgi:hypothetical protein